MVEFILWFGGGALGYAAALTVVAIAAMRIFAGRILWRALPLVFCAGAFVALTQHPFPEPGALDCPVASAAPLLRPFGFIAPITRLLEQDASLSDWLGNRWFMATLLNYLVCCVIGVCWGLNGGGVRAAVFFGFGLSLACELTQLTGIWGIYPCAYRAFNVDDLLLNTLGCVSGAALFAWRRGRRHP